MKKLKEDNGKYYQECQVIMLATKERKGRISMANTSKHLEYHNFDIEKGGIYNNHTFQHLYIVSDEEIKTDDWFLADTRNHTSENNGQPIWELKQCARTDNGWIFTKGGIGYNPEWSRKIISTTDLSITTVDNGGDKSLPQPSKLFIQKYIEEYNKGNVIEKVLVEYDVNWIAGTSTYGHGEYDYRLKTDSHNCITIKPIKDSWTREEVIELINQAVGESHDWSKENDDIHSISIIEKRFLNKWVEENL